MLFATPAMLHVYTALEAFTRGLVAQTTLSSSRRIVSRARLGTILNGATQVTVDVPRSAEARAVSQVHL